MVWRLWGNGPPLVLFHGGYGAWTHWIRNVLVLARQFTVIAPDLPGLGESATPPEPHTAEELARIIVDGLAIILPGGKRFPSRRLLVRRGARRPCRGIAGRAGARLHDRRLERARPAAPADRARAPEARRDRRGAACIAKSQSRRADDRRQGQDRRPCRLHPVHERAARPGQEPALFAHRHAAPGACRA